MLVSSPPFEITHVSPEPIMHEAFLNESFGWAYRAVNFIAFPMGFVIMDPFIYLSYGKNDRDSWVLKLNKTGLLSSLKPVQSVVLGTSECHKDSGKVVRGSFKQIRNSSLNPSTLSPAVPVPVPVPVINDKHYIRKMAEFLRMSERQVSFVLDTWLVKHAWINPSMIFDVENKEKIVMVWRVPDKVR